MISFETQPGPLHHWKIGFDGPVATLTLDIAEDKPLVPGYKLKLNSYDLGVDIELADALNRIRFEHPEVKSVVITSGKSRMFCSGANIYMLGHSSHAWKVNFCKFTNETRNGIEEARAGSGLKFLAALNGTTAGGGYELALACDEIAMIDDRSSTVSLPEVPLLGVLPGTGGLTRLVDKRKVRRDLADVFCTTAEGVRADRAKQWKPGRPHGEAAAVRRDGEGPRAGARQALGPPRRTRRCPDPARRQPPDRRQDRPGDSHRQPDREGPRGGQARAQRRLVSAAPRARARRAILDLRQNQLDIGLWVLKSKGDLQAVLEMDAVLEKNKGDWFVREVDRLPAAARSRASTCPRAPCSPSSSKGSCFAGTLLELVLRRRPQLHAGRRGRAADRAIAAQLRHLSHGERPLAPGNALLRRTPRSTGRRALDTAKARDLGLVTATPDDIDWEDEVRIAIEERASLSPDALTGMEASLRFAGPETMLTRVFGRLTAWQNWIFNRPNAVGEQGALKVYGTGAKAKFNWERV